MTLFHKPSLKICTGKDGHLKLNFNNKTANINGKILPVSNQV